MILHGSVFSKTVGMQTGLTVFTPEALSEENENYKVVYLLHGLHGNSQVWLNNTMLTQYAGNANAIVIMPEVGRSFYANMKHGYNYFTYISGELPQIVSNVFHISAKREDTAIIGCSMGGYGALKIALSKPEQYGFCGAISPACLFLHDYLSRLKTEGAEWASHSDTNAALLQDFYAIFGDELEQNNEDSIPFLAESCAKSKQKPQIWAACGAEDELIEENRSFCKAINKIKELDYTFEEWTGIHNWIFFNEALKRALNAWIKGNTKE